VTAQAFQHEEMELMGASAETVAKCERFASDITDLWMEANNYANGVDVPEAVKYALSDPAEFIAEIGNPHVQMFIGKIPFRNTGESILSAFMRRVATLFGFGEPNTIGYEVLRRFDDFMIELIDSSNIPNEAMTLIYGKPGRFNRAWAAPVVLDNQRTAEATANVTYHETTWWQRHMNSDEGVRNFTATIRRVIGDAIPSKYDIYAAVKTLPHRVEGRQSRDRSNHIVPMFAALDAMQARLGLTKPQMEAAMEKYRQWHYYNTAATSAVKFAAVHSKLDTEESREAREDLLITIRNPQSSAAMRKSAMQQMIGLWMADGDTTSAAKYFGIAPAKAAKNAAELMKDPLLQEVVSTVEPFVKSALDAINLHNRDAGVLGKVDMFMRDAYGFKHHIPTHWAKDDLMAFTQSDQTNLHDSVGMVVEEDPEGKKHVGSYMHPLQSLSGELLASGRRVEENKTTEVLYNLTKDYGTKLGLEFANNGMARNM
jgi:hypothetical protein